MQIILNGKGYKTNAKNLKELAQEYVGKREPPKELVTIVNGFLESGETNIKEADLVFLIEKGKMPDKEQLQAMMYARHTPHVQEKLENGRVAVAGLGGLGSNIAISLARIGVGHLHLIDYDVVEPSNLNRQQYYIRHLGMKKTEAMKELLGEINPFIEVKTTCYRLEKENVLALLQEEDIICEAFDSPEAKAMLLEELLTKAPEKKIVSASGMAGFTSSNAIHTKRFGKNLYLCGDGVSGAEQGNGLMAPRVAVCAGHQANMVLRLLVDEREC